MGLESRAKDEARIISGMFRHRTRDNRHKLKCREFHLNLKKTQTIKVTE